MKIGICGLIGCGKSNVSKLIADKRNYHYINSDVVFKTWVEKHSDYKRNITNFLNELDVPAFVNGKYNSIGIAELIFNDRQAQYNFPILKALNKVNSQYIVQAIKTSAFSHDNVIVEMATIPANEYISNFVDVNIMVLGDGWSSDPHNSYNHFKRIQTRDSRSEQINNNILQYQRNVLNNFTNNQNSVFPLNNMKVEKHESYLSDDEILAQFDEIVKSTKAISFVARNNKNMKDAKC